MYKAGQAGHAPGQFQRRANRLGLLLCKASEQGSQLFYAIR